jgi:hypothetical protein
MDIYITDADAALDPETGHLVVWLTTGVRDIPTRFVMRRQVADLLIGRLMDPDPSEERA